MRCSFSTGRRRPGDLALWPKARERLGFDEVFSAQLAIALVRRGYRQLAGRSLVGDGQLAQKMRAALPYSLTRSQEQALAEIKSDMAAPRRMLRLLQGDVGAGKTVVAALAMAAAVEAGAQAAIMAPTDVLARQHLETLTPLCEAAGVSLGYLSGREQGKTRAAHAGKARRGRPSRSSPERMRCSSPMSSSKISASPSSTSSTASAWPSGSRLQEKARNGDADILVMTATPIPRTLLLSLHGDLDVSKLTEKPAGRKPVSTRAIPQDRLEELVEGLHRALREGAQVYWVCPAVESDTMREMTAAEERAAHLRQVFGERVGLVHGRLSGAEKDAAIAAFAARETSILVATTVIEVGVNVPNATVMIVENAEMFGLAQLHQLRGRVGRGAAQSSCVLLYKGSAFGNRQGAPRHSPAGRRRLRDRGGGFAAARRRRGAGCRVRAAIRASGSRLGRKQRRSSSGRRICRNISSPAIPISNPRKDWRRGAALRCSSAMTRCGCCRRGDYLPPATMRGRAPRLNVAPNPYGARDLPLTAAAASTGRAGAGPSTTPGVLRK